MTEADKAYERIIALTNQIGKLGEQLEIATQQFIDAKDAEWWLTSN